MIQGFGVCSVCVVVRVCVGEGFCLRISLFVILYCERELNVYMAPSPAIILEINSYISFDFENILGEKYPTRERMRGQENVSGWSMGCLFWILVLSGELIFKFYKYIN